MVVVNNKIIDNPKSKVIDVLGKKALKLLKPSKKTFTKLTPNNKKYPLKPCDSPSLLIIFRIYIAKKLKTKKSMASYKEVRCLLPSIF